ncbi:hypothetical protein BDQ12DRAFT_717051 [Crucibulum laeve]|uniref:ABC transporter domain-containing protein n=1 Tax=Crucibulum laeve TaxID=68775 RepID=A0A5C3LE41_9AGAR|nr:hypothetical protein BDQ12DRAFT_717051 [Crucibulum laeve]
MKFLFEFELLAADVVTAASSTSFHLAVWLLSINSEWIVEGRRLLQLFDFNHDDRTPSTRLLFFLSPGNNTTTSSLQSSQAFDAFVQFPLTANPPQVTKDVLLRRVGIAALEFLGLTVGSLALSSITSSLWIWTRGSEQEEQQGPLDTGGLMAKFTRETDECPNGDFSHLRHAPPIPHNLLHLPTPRIPPLLGPDSRHPICCSGPYDHSRPVTRFGFAPSCRRVLTDGVSQPLSLSMLSPPLPTATEHKFWSRVCQTQRRSEEAQQHLGSHLCDGSIRHDEHFGAELVCEGQGKSTVAQLLMRMYEPQRGSVMLDEQDVRFLDEEWMQMHVAGVGQGTQGGVVILDGMSVLENVALGVVGRYPGKEEVEESCRVALMHKFVRAFLGDTIPSLGQALVSS